MTSIRFPRRGLYLITPDGGDSEALLARVEPLLPWAACLQYRNKRASPGQARIEAMRLGDACRRAGVCFIVNDAPQLAFDVEADGVHIGEDDGGIAAARALLGPSRAIGVSCYDDAGRARDAVAAGADYIAFGALFPSATKPHARRATPALFAAAASLGVPKVAIGGITPDNARGAIEAGADLIAVIGGVFDAPDPVAAARACAAAFRTQEENAR